MCRQSVSLMRDKISRYKWAIFIIALVAIDIIWIAGIWIYFASSQERISLITQLITFNSILIAGMGIAYQVEATKEREFQLKIQQQRREEYTKILNLMKEGLHQELIKRAIENSSEAPNETKINELRKLLDAQFAMMVYASAEFINQYVRHRDLNAATERQRPFQDAAARETAAMEALIRDGELISQIRKEIGFGDQSVPIRRLLSIDWDRITNKEFDPYFKK
ncbi:MAG: hypothetical protein WAW52_05665 [Methanothrix sp.]